MHLKMKTLAAVLLSFIVLPSLAPTNAAPPPASQPVVPTEDLQDKLLSLDQQDIPLKDFLDFVQSSVPGFQYVILRDPGISADYPTLPPMKLRKVTLGQVLDIIQDIYPLVQFHLVHSDGGELYVFKVRSGSVDDVGEAPKSVLKVYRLTEAVEAVAARIAPPLPPELKPAPEGGLFGGDPDPATAPARKKARDEYDAAVQAAQTSAMNSVLSLIKAALAQAGDSRVTPLVQIHEETRTLILRGTADHVNAVQKALEALTPQAALAPLKEQFAATQHHMESELAKANDETARRSVELQEARTEADTLRKSLLELEAAQERLKVQLEAVKKKPTTKE